MIRTISGMPPPPTHTPPLFIGEDVYEDPDVENGLYCSIVPSDCQFPACPPRASTNMKTVYPLGRTLLGRAAPRARAVGGGQVGGRGIECRHLVGGGVKSQQ